ncbi:hypothetical protein VT03_32145 [Planctomyces sp. SH-PL14]|nr:hypothetical protein VT03_32145 [Planctomyces sp. SH-PL14]
MISRGGYWVEFVYDDVRFNIAGSTGVQGLALVRSAEGPVSFFGALCPPEA